MSAQRRPAAKRTATAERSPKVERSPKGANGNRATRAPRRSDPKAVTAEAPTNLGQSSGRALRRAEAKPARAEATGETAQPARREPRRAAPKPKRGQQAETGRRFQLVSAERTEGMRRFYREIASEIKKVNWPDQLTTRNLTLVVIAVSAVLGIMLGGIDFVLFQLFEALP